MALAGIHTISIYNSKIREIGHMTAFDGTRYIIINQTHWYPADKYTDETAKLAFLNRNK